MAELTVYLKAKLRIKTETQFVFWKHFWEQMMFYKIEIQFQELRLPEIKKTKLRFQQSWEWSSSRRNGGLESEKTGGGWSFRWPPFVRIFRIIIYKVVIWINYLGKEHEMEEDKNVYLSILLSVYSVPNHINFRRFTKLVYNYAPVFGLIVVVVKSFW